MANILNILDKDTGKYVSVPAIQGASAYEVAVENGFEGSEQEWLDSLKGEGADVDMSNYATIDYVDEAVSNLDIDSSEINLDGYATEEWTKEYINENIEEISNGYYESTQLAGEDITDDIIAANGELPMLRTFKGGTKYIVSGGVTNLMINTNNDAATFYINDYESMDANQKFELTGTADGDVPDYFVYGAYNKDLLTKTDLSEPQKTNINYYLNQSREDQYFVSLGSGGTKLMCGWSFYGRRWGEDDESWTSTRINSGTVSPEIEDALNKLPNQDNIKNQFSDGTPGRGYRKSPCMVIPVKPYTTYTINYTGEENYMNGLHYCLINQYPEGGGCAGIPIFHEKHLKNTKTSTFITGGNVMYLVLFVGRLRSVNAQIEDVTYGWASEGTSNINLDVVAYNINNLSVVEGNQTYEYYIDMIKDIDFKINITAMSMYDNSQYATYSITIPYIMKSNQFFRFNREKELWVVSRALTKAVGMRMDEINDNNLNYKANEIGVIGKWIDSKDIYRTVIQVQMPAFDEDDTYASSSQKTAVLLPDAVDTIVDLRATFYPYGITQTWKTSRLLNTWQNTGHYNSNWNYTNEDFKTEIITYFPPSYNLYSELQITYGFDYRNVKLAIILEYTKYEYQEDGVTIV